VHGIARQRRWEEHDCDLQFIKSKVEYINGGIENVVRRKSLAGRVLTRFVSTRETRRAIEYRVWELQKGCDGVVGIKIIKLFWCLYSFVCVHVCCREKPSLLSE
jgi:hypothetical protein